MAYSGGDPREVTNFQLKASYWYVTHRDLLYRIAVGLLIALCVVLYGFTFYKVGILIVRDQPIWSQSLSEAGKLGINYAYFRKDQGPQPLQIVTFNTVASNEGAYDYVVQLQNSNNNFVAQSVTLQLVAGSSVIAEKKTFVYPGEHKYVTFFAQQTGAGNAIVRVSNVSWLRDPQFTAFVEPRTRFVVSDVKLETLSDPRVQTPVSTLRFTIKNDSAFSYWQLGVHMTALAGGQVVGANYTILDQFRSGEIRTVDIRWSGVLAGANETEILPEVNVLDKGIYMSN